MKLSFDSRSWHAWISVALAIPILIVSITAIFLAHEHSLGLKEVPVAAQWLPGYRAQPGAQRWEVRAALVARDGATWLGTKAGLLRVAGGEGRAVQPLEGIEVRGLAETPDGILVATKRGVWLGRGDDWRLLEKGESWSVTRAADGKLSATTRERGMIVSRDGGKSWQESPQALAVLATLPAPPPEEITLGKLMIDMHTGKAFLGKESMWAWIDLIGIVMTFLGITGVYMWWRGQKRKAASAAAQRTPPAPAAAATEH
jgi:hypothetical protein